MSTCLGLTHLIPTKWKQRRHSPKAGMVTSVPNFEIVLCNRVKILSYPDHRGPEWLQVDQALLWIKNKMSAIISKERFPKSQWFSTPLR